MCRKPRAPGAHAPGTDPCRAPPSTAPIPPLDVQSHLKRLALLDRRGPFAARLRLAENRGSHAGARWGGSVGSPSRSRMRRMRPVSVTNATGAPIGSKVLGSLKILDAAIRGHMRMFWVVGWSSVRVATKSGYVVRGQRTASLSGDSSSGATKTAGPLDVCAVHVRVGCHSQPDLGGEVSDDERTPADPPAAAFVKRATDKPVNHSWWAARAS